MTNTSLEIEHCHAVCAELRERLTKAKRSAELLAVEVDEANDRAGVLAEHIQEQLNSRSFIESRLRTATADRELLLATLEMVLPHLGFQNYDDQELIDGDYGIANVLVPARAVIAKIRDRGL